MNDVVRTHNLRGDIVRDSGHGRIVHHGRREELARHSSRAAERCGDALRYPPEADEGFLAEIGVEEAEGAGRVDGMQWPSNGCFGCCSEPTARERNAQCKGMRYSLGGPNPWTDEGIACGLDCIRA